MTAVERFLAEADTAFDNVVERTADDVARLLAHGSAFGVRNEIGQLLGVAGGVEGDECLLRVSGRAPERAPLLRAGLRLLQGPLSTGTPLWLPSLDREAGEAAARQGLTLQYTDLQMRTDAIAGAGADLPPGTMVRPFGGTEIDLRAVHQLVCEAWGVGDHWAPFLERFGDVARDSGLWVLLDNAEGTLVAACFGDVQRLADGTFGVVRHLDVSPSERGRGLGTWALTELTRRFAAIGVTQMQLGVHGDNASGAPALYRSLGWRVVSSQDKWVRSRPS